MDRFIIRFVSSKTFSKVDFNLAFLLSYTKCTRLAKKDRYGPRGRKLTFYNCWITFWETFPKTQCGGMKRLSKRILKTSSRLPGSCRRCCYFSTETRQPLWRTIIQYDHLLGIYQTLLRLKKSNAIKVFTHLMHIMWCFGNRLETGLSKIDSYEWQKVRLLEGRQLWLKRIWVLKWLPIRLTMFQALKNFTDIIAYYQCLDEFEHNKYSNIKIK